jgi:hypothetical protein
MLETIIKLLKRFRNEKRGVSNVIVVMLSLILVVVIASNVILWSYQMNQLDWEKMQEKIEIIDVVSVWYYLGFDYRAQHSIKGSTAGKVTDYQMRITIINGTGTSSGNIYYTTHVSQPDFDDVRFSWYNTTSGQEQAIPYWCEVAYTGANATFWIKVPEISASPDLATIYIYYGNSSVTNSSDISNTLEANYTKINVPYGWTEKVSTSDVANGDDVGSWQNIPFNFPFWREFKSRVYVCSNGFGIFDPTTSTNDYSDSLAELMARWKIAPFWDDLRTDVAGGIVSTPGVYVDRYPDRMMITWETTRYGAAADSIKFQAILYRNGDVSYNIDNATNFSSFTPTLGISKGDNTNYVDITNERSAQKSWLFTLRKYVDPEPSHGEWGSEEKQGIILKLRNTGASTVHVVSLWVSDSAFHRRYDADIFVSSGENVTHSCSDINLPKNDYIIKVITERGNIAIFSKH